MRLGLFPITSIKLITAHKIEKLQRLSLYVEFVTKPFSIYRVISKQLGGRV
jgi:hypothetical protein